MIIVHNVVLFVKNRNLVLALSLRKQHNVGFYIYLRKENIMDKKLLEIMRDKIRFKHYSIKTEQRATRS
jgi:hypothetical protein